MRVVAREHTEEMRTVRLSLKMPTRAYLLLAYSYYKPGTLVAYAAPTARFLVAVAGRALRLSTLLRLR